ncbi:MULTISPECIES: penicillin-binding protein 1A [Ramlibacter]|uniref:Penicillin-binding protein 1A n=1 Tax=Ramlibacter pinisoli TaxID=2682844 RepID=A0A6N8J2T3_9BURK|nr:MULTISPECIES: penicillin-binding protein 1A [Ramlibacter]MBA2962584.1 penicillin-binding protein 1A [Ramlibacter sp. CGMCC 1.13660]MVQ32526.1 PBP1A family penicillin-binding protein [Ramlibacter pinisoli]
MPSDSSSDGRGSSRRGPTWKRRLLQAFLWLVGGALAAVASAVIVAGVALAVAYPNLPDISELSNYRPKLPLRVFSAEGVLLGEFGEERRNLTPIAEIPAVMKNAVLAIEDARFYSHSGVDYKGLVRAAVANLGRAKSQGASTITMQVARNVYLSSEKTFTRKLYEILLTFKLEHLLTKDQILEIYMNQIFLGNRAYGFAAASEAYFGKPMKDLTVAEAAMLAGLPKAPSAYNPISNPSRARTRQLYIIERMEENGFITSAQAEAAKRQELKVRPPNEHGRVHAEYVAETVRQLVYSQYGDDAYTRGLNVVTSVKSVQQEAAYRALRKGIMDYEKRQIYRGPEEFIDLPADRKEQEDAIDDALADHPDNGDVMSAVVLEAGPKKIIAVRQNGDRFEITGDGLRPAQSGLSDKAPPKIKIRPGAVIRVMQTPKSTWEITQLPEVEGAFVALDPKDGSVLAMVGGFDFYKNKFNHVTQAWRQPGSGFKPFIYSAALEKGFTPATIVNDAPLFFDAGVTGGQPWEPKNYDGKFEGPMPLHTALAKSKNMVSIRILQAVGTQNAQDWISRFGFEPEKHPPYLTMALGAGSVTPMQMATGYAVFANGGYRVNPWLISRIVDHKGKVLVETQPPLPTEAVRAIDARNAFVMDRLLQEITRSGTAARAQQVLKRPDLYGKTGTTNDSIDTWFNGFHPSVVAIVWMGYDNPRPLGDRETGGSMSLPVWINFMETALKGVPEVVPTAPEGVVNVGGEWFYEEYSRGGGVSSLGVTPTPQVEPVPISGTSGAGPARPASVPLGPAMSPAPDGNSAPSPSRPPEERRSILDLFRN